MEVKSTYKYARISPKKARDVARAIQGMPVSEALDALAYTPRKAAQLVGKTLKSAVANAENNHELIADELTVKQVASVLATFISLSLTRKKSPSHVSAHPSLRSATRFPSLRRKRHLPKPPKRRKRKKHPRRAKR